MLGKLSALTSLKLHGNRLTAMPPTIGHLTSLRELTANDNALTEVPASLGRLAQLRHLDLGKAAVCACYIHTTTTCTRALHFSTSVFFIVHRQKPPKNMNEEKKKRKKNVHLLHLCASAPLESGIEANTRVV